MAEYIDKEKLSQKLSRMIMTEFGDAIMDCHIADVAPVVHGRWIEQEKYTFGVMYDCSICDNRILDNGYPWNYCPNCGAKMDGKEESEDEA